MLFLQSDPHHQTAANETAGQKDSERLQLRRLQMMVGMVLSVLSQDSHLTIDEAREMVANCRGTALAMFPGKELAFDLIYRPRLERAIMERFPSP